MSLLSDSESTRWIEQAERWEAVRMGCQCNAPPVLIHYAGCQHASRAQRLGSHNTPKGPIPLGLNNHKALAREASCSKQS